VVKALHRKLLRDLWRLRLQSLTIAVLVGCGIASFVTAVTASASMQASRDIFYAEARLGDLFDGLKRAPQAVVDRLRDLPGVAVAQGRIVKDFNVEIPGSMEPVSARFVSLRWPQEDQLNQVRVRTGRLIEPGRSDEILVSDIFAETWDLVPGSTISAVVDERRVRLRVVGTAVSPDFASVSSPRTGLPDPRHFGVVWMDEDALAKATGFVGAFNDVALRLSGGADEAETLRAVDRVLEPYGGLGAIGRADQPSAKLVGQKIKQLAKLATSLPLVFLAIASFLQNILLSRTVAAQREQIATLKALGYRSRELVAHYLELAAVTSALGVAFGVALGLLGARGLLALYAHYFDFPEYVHRLDARAVIAAVAVALASGLGGSWRAVHRATAIPAAEAMRPEAPPTYRRTLLDPVYARLSPLVRMVLRDLQRRPVRLALSSGSIALATSIVVAGGAFGDSIRAVLRLEFEVARREQITVTLDGPRPWRAVGDVAHVPGVIRAEGERVVPVRLRVGARSRTTSILGLSPDTDLHVLLDVTQRPLALPRTGLSLSRTLADAIGARAGDAVDVEVLEEDRRVLHLQVAALVDDLLGMTGYMNSAELARLLDEQPRVNVVLVAADPRDVDAVTLRLNDLPAAAAVSRPAVDRSLVQGEVADAFAVLSLLLSCFAAAIAIGVVYNNARVALEVRARDLATMRILGFSRAELAGVLLGEQAIQVIAGLVPGLWLGKGLGALWMSGVDRELLRIPLTLSPAAYVAAGCVVALSALASGLFVRRLADRLDLVAVLKARD
jgi:putative ABC transport system permease protein